MTSHIKKTLQIAGQGNSRRLFRRKQGLRLDPDLGIGRVILWAEHISNCGWDFSTYSTNHLPRPLRPHNHQSGDANTLDYDPGL